MQDILSLLTRLTGLILILLVTIRMLIKNIKCLRLKDRVENSGYHKQFYNLAEEIIMPQRFGNCISLYFLYALLWL